MHTPNTDSCNTKGETTRVLGTIPEIIERLDRAYGKLWHSEKCWPVINQVLAGKDRVTRQNRAQALAIYSEVIHLKTDQFKKFKLADIHRIVIGYPLTKPKLSTYTKFEQFVNRGPGRSFDELVEYLRDRPRGTGNTKIGTGLMKLIKAFYADERKMNLSRITELVNHAIREHVASNGYQATIEYFELPNSASIAQTLQTGAAYLSESAIKKALSRETRNSLSRSRYGQAWFRNEMVKPLIRRPAQNPLDRVEFDSTKFSFVFRDDKGNASTVLSTCIVVDCCTGKILGYSFDKYESGKLAIEAIKNAFCNIGFLPGELFTDRFPGHNSEEIKYFFTQLKKLGCIVTLERTGNPRAKGTVESTINSLCELAKEYPNFIGKNINTTSKESRKSDEARTVMVRASNLVSLEYVKGQLIELMSLYNSRVTKGREHSRANHFAILPKPNATSLTLESKVWLFHKAVEKKVVKGGLIVFESKKFSDAKYYEISDFEHRLRYNGASVRVRYTDDDLQTGVEIFLFDMKTDEFICTCLPMNIPNQAKVNRDDVDDEIINNHIVDKKKFNQFIKEREEEVSQIDVVTYLNSSKTEQIEADNLYELQQQTKDRLPYDRDAIELEHGAVMIGKESIVDPHGRNKDDRYQYINLMDEPKPIMDVTRDEAELKRLEDLSEWLLSRDD